MRIELGDIPGPWGLWGTWAHCPSHQTLTSFTVCQLGPLGPNSGCLPSPSVCAGSMVPGEEELDVVRQLLLTPWARDLTPPPPPANLHIGNNTTYLKRWLYGLGHLRQLSHTVKLLKVPLLTSREPPCSSGAIEMGEAGHGLGCSLVPTSLPSSLMVPSWV